MATPVPVISALFEAPVEHHMKLETRNPSMNVCLTFGHCRDLRRAVTVSWWEIPLHKVVDFYEAAECHGPAIVSSRGAGDTVDGWHMFHPHHWIRSMLYRYNSSSHPLDIHVVPTCGFQPIRAYFDSTTIGANDTQADASGEEGFADGLSSNWAHALPDKSKKAGSSLYGDERVGRNQ